MTDELTCTFHDGHECMGYGHLVLWLNGDVGPLPEALADIPGTTLYSSLGNFCTVSALYAWLEGHGAIAGARPGDLHARRPGTRGGGDQRPTVRTPRRRMTRG